MEKQRGVDLHEQRLESLADRQQSVFATAHHIQLAPQLAEQQSTRGVERHSVSVHIACPMTSYGYIRTSIVYSFPLFDFRSRNTNISQMRNRS